MIWLYYFVITQEATTMWNFDVFSSKLDMDTLIDKMLDNSRSPLSYDVHVNGACDAIVKRTDKTYELEVGVPGCAAADIQVKFLGTQLQLSTKRGSKSTTNTYKLPIDAELSQATSKVVNGLFTIVIPKKGNVSSEGWTDLKVD